MRTISAEYLLPAKWSAQTSPDKCYFFNPSIADLDGRLIMAYRVVLPDMLRRIAICELDENFVVQPLSAFPLSDYLTGAGCWHADPRFCQLGDRLFLHFNNGAVVPNDIFMVGIDQENFSPLGPCRKLTINHRRQLVEKNWMFFEHDGELFGIYSIAPHSVHRVHLDSPGDTIECESAYVSSWDVSVYARSFGTPRGSTPPIRVGDSYFSFFHSQYRKSLGRRLYNSVKVGTAIRANSYGIGCYAFDAKPPFLPTLILSEQLIECPLRPLANRPRLSNSYDSCLYPSGAVYREGLWTISMGVHDDGCALLEVSHESLLDRCWPALCHDKH